MDNLGVAINDTTLNTYALTKGLGKTTQQMTTAEKVSLAFEYFMEKTAQYAGNYAKENDTYAGSINTLNAAWENFLSGAGDADAVIESAEGALNAIWRTAQNLVPKLWTGAKRMLDKAWPKVSTWLGQQLRALPQRVADFAVDGANGIIDIINSVFGTKIPHIDTIKLPTWSEISGWATKQINKLIDGINTVFNSNIPHIDDIKLPSVADVVQKVTDWWNAEDGVAQKIRDVAKFSLQVAGIEDVTNETEEWQGAVGEVQKGLVTLGGAWATYQIGEKISQIAGLISQAGGIKGIISTFLGGINPVGLALGAIAAGVLLVATHWKEVSAWLDDATEKLLNFFGIQTRYTQAEVLQADVKDLQEAVDTLNSIAGMGGDEGRRNALAYLQTIAGVAGNSLDDATRVRNFLTAEQMQRLESGAFASREELDAFLGEIVQALITALQTQSDELDKATEDYTENAGKSADELTEGATTVGRSFEETSETAETVAAKFAEAAAAAENAAAALNSIEVPLGSVEGSFAKGTNYVPNAMIARLHRGEAVLTAVEAARWRENGGRGQDYSGASTIVEALQGLRADFENMRLYVGEKEFGRAVVDYGGNRVNSYIGGANRRMRKGYGAT